MVRTTATVLRRGQHSAVQEDSGRRIRAGRCGFLAAGDSARRRSTAGVA